MTKLQCRCGQSLGERNGNTLIYGEIRLPIPRTTHLECGRCGTQTAFKVDSKMSTRKNSVVVDISLLTTRDGID